MQRMKMVGISENTSESENFAIFEHVIDLVAGR